MLGFFLYTRISARKKLLYTGLYYKHHPLVRQTLELSTPSPHACCHCSVHKGNAGALSIAAHRATEQQKDLQEAVTLSNCYPGKTQYSETDHNTKQHAAGLGVFGVSSQKERTIRDVLWYQNMAQDRHSLYKTCQAFTTSQHISIFLIFSPLACSIALKEQEWTVVQLLLSFATWCLDLVKQSDATLTHINFCFRRRCICG